MIALYAHAALFALFVWYFSTGAILYLDGLPRHTFRASMAVATVLLAVALHGLALSSADTTPTGAYLAFTYGVLAWAWQEMAFLMGFLTGPKAGRRPAGAAPSTGWRHFGHAVMAVLYHELALLAGAGLILAVTWGGANQIGMWTYMVLWGMRTSAKFNVFLGVRNLSLDFLPPHMMFLKPYLTQKPMNLLFPISVTASSLLAMWLVQRATASGISHFAATSFTFLATMTALALVEHWFLVLPLPFGQLWQWGLRSRRGSAPGRRASSFRVIDGGALVTVPAHASQQNTP